MLKSSVYSPSYSTPVIVVLSFCMLLILTWKLQLSYYLPLCNNFCLLLNASRLKFNTSVKIDLI